MFFYINSKFGIQSKFWLLVNRNKASLVVDNNRLGAMVTQPVSSIVKGQRLLNTVTVTLLRNGHRSRIYNPFLQGELLRRKTNQRCLMEFC